MCFHNALSKTAVEIQNRFGVVFKEKSSFNPVYHGSGFSYMNWPLILQESPDQVTLLRWGLIPFWVKDDIEAQSIRAKTLNAQGESIFEKPSFKYSVSHKRCLVPSSGFFEWQHTGKNKYPYFIFPQKDDIMAMGGLYSTWTNKNTGREIKTFSIITTSANNLMSQIHNSKKRMPLILSKEDEHLWLNPYLSQKDINMLIKPAKEDILDAYTVGRLVSSQHADTNIPEVQKFYQYPEFNTLF